MEIEIKKLKDQDLEKFIDLVKLFKVVFEMKNISLPDTEHLQNTLSKPDFMVFVAIKQRQVIGGLTAYKLDRYYSKKPLAYIYDLAVSTEYQRQGIGKNLILGINKYCRKNGFEEVFVQADQMDDHAIDFYRSTQISAEEQAVHFSYKVDTSEFEREK